MTPNPRFPSAGQLLTDSDGVCVGNSYKGYLKAALEKGQITQNDIPYREKLVPTTLRDKKAQRIGKRKLVTSW